MNLIYRKIEHNDYNKGIIELLQKFSNFDCDISNEEFNCYINDNKNIYILVVEDLDTNKIIASGSLLILKKVHNNINSIGFVQDVIVDENYRCCGIGGKLLNELVKIGKDNRCYKVILDCNDDLILFYEHNGFKRKGNEMEMRF